MIKRRLTFILITALALFAISGCHKTTNEEGDTLPTPTPQISENKAIAIASTQIPLKVIVRATIQVDQVSGWRVIFEDVYTTKEELVWQEDDITRFQWEGSTNVPEGVYRAVMVAVSPVNGEILSRVATNSIFLGMPQ